MVYSMDFLAFTIIIQVNQRLLHLQHSRPLFYVLYNMYIPFIYFIAL